jgi:hypothetical protein
VARDSSCDGLDLEGDELDNDDDNQQYFDGMGGDDEASSDDNDDGRRYRPEVGEVSMRPFLEIKNIPNG